MGQFCFNWSLYNLFIQSAICPTMPRTRTRNFGSRSSWWWDEVFDDTIVLEILTLWHGSMTHGICIDELFGRLRDQCTQALQRFGCYGMSKPNLAWWKHSRVVSVRWWLWVHSVHVFHSIAFTWPPSHANLFSWLSKQVQQLAWFLFPDFPCIAYHHHHHYHQFNVHFLPR